MNRIRRLFPNQRRNETEILENIEALLAQQSGMHPEQMRQKAETRGDGGPSGVRLMDSNRYLVLETADLDGANDDGTVTLEPGEEKTLIRYDQDATAALLALGANDAQNVIYTTRANGKKALGGKTHSPLGQVNFPFSFVDQLGAALPIESLEYRAKLMPDAEFDVRLAARAHLEVLD